MPQECLQKGKAQHIRNAVKLHLSLGYQSANGFLIGCSGVHIDDDAALNLARKDVGAKTG